MAIQHENQNLNINDEHAYSVIGSDSGGMTGYDKHMLNKNPQNRGVTPPYNGYGMGYNVINGAYVPYSNYGMSGAFYPGMPIYNQPTYINTNQGLFPAYLNPNGMFGLQPPYPTPIVAEPAYYKNPNIAPTTTQQVPQKQVAPAQQSCQNPNNNRVFTQQNVANQNKPANAPQGIPQPINKNVAAKECACSDATVSQQPIMRMNVGVPENNFKYFCNRDNDFTDIHPTPVATKPIDIIEQSGSYSEYLSNAKMRGLTEGILTREEFDARKINEAKPSGSQKNDDTKKHPIKKWVTTFFESKGLQLSKNAMIVMSAYIIAIVICVCAILFVNRNEAPDLADATYEPASYEVMESMELSEEEYSNEDNKFDAFLDIFNKE